MNIRLKNALIIPSVIAALAIAVPTPRAHAVSKEIVQLQEQVQQLQDALQHLQDTNNQQNPENH